MTLGGVCGLIATIIGNRFNKLHSLPDEAVCISLFTNALRKGMNPPFLLPVMS